MYISLNILAILYIVEDVERFVILNLFSEFTFENCMRL